MHGLCTKTAKTKQRPENELKPWLKHPDHQKDPLDMFGLVSRGESGFAQSYFLLKRRINGA